MIWILSAIFASMCTVGQSAFTKIASTKGKTNGLMYINTLKVGASLIFFLLISFYKLQFHVPTVVFASVYGFALFFSTLFGYMALMHGSMALTSLIVSYSVIITYIKCISQLTSVCFYDIFYYGKCLRWKGFLLCSQDKIHCRRE